MWSMIGVDTSWIPAFPSQLNPLTLVGWCIRAFASIPIPLPFNDGDGVLTIPLYQLFFSALFLLMVVKFLLSLFGSSVDPNAVVDATMQTDAAMLEFRHGSVLGSVRRSLSNWKSPGRR